MKPCSFRIRQTSRPERVWSLPNGHLDRGHVDFAAQPLLDLRRAGGLKEELQGFDQVASGLFDGPALTGKVELRSPVTGSGLWDVAHERGCRAVGRPGTRCSIAPRSPRARRRPAVASLIDGDLGHQGRGRFRYSLAQLLEVFQGEKYRLTNVGQRLFTRIALGVAPRKGGALDEEPAVRLR